MNLLIKIKNKWSIGNDGSNLVKKSTKLKCETSYVEFVEINIIM
jgi:hypothetical protein